MTSKWIPGGEALTPQAIETTARALGGSLPLALTQFYEHHNGGWPDDETPHPCGIHGYVPIGPRPSDVEQLAADLREQDPALNGMFPFAYDAGGNIFLVSLQDHDHGAPYVYLHQTADLEHLDCNLNDLLPDH